MADYGLCREFCRWDGKALGEVLLMRLGGVPEGGVGVMDFLFWEVAMPCRGKEGPRFPRGGLPRVLIR